MARANTRRLTDFTGGEAAIFAASAMNPKYSMLLQNAYITERGGLAKIPGYTALNTAAVAETLREGYDYRKSDGTLQVLVAGGGTVYKKAGAALTAIVINLDASAIMRFESMQDKVGIFNGVNAPMIYDGVSVSAMGGTPPATAFKGHVFQGRMWLIDKTNKMQATYSALNDMEDYVTASNAGYYDFRDILGTGDELVDLCTYLSMLVFVFLNHIVIYSGTNPTEAGDFQLVQIVRGVGALETGLVQNLGTDNVVLGRSGLQSFNQVVTTGNLKTNQLSRVVQPTIEQLIRDNTDDIYASCHYPARSWYMVLIGATVLIYSYVFKAWVGRIVGADIKGMFTDADGNLYFCGTGYLYQFAPNDNTFDFNGNDITWLWKSAWVQLNKGGQKGYPSMMDIVFTPGDIVDIGTQLLYDLTFVANGETFTLEPGASLMDTAATTDIWDAAFLMDNGTVDPVRIGLDGGGRTLQLIFSNVSSDGPFEINDITIQVNPGGMN